MEKKGGGRDMLNYLKKVMMVLMILLLFAFASMMVGCDTEEPDTEVDNDCEDEIDLREG